jgi:hypothetical protein
MNPKSLKDLASCLYNSVHIESSGLKPLNEQHQYTPWLFEHAYVRTLVTDSDKQMLPEPMLNVL